MEKLSLNTHTQGVQSLLPQQCQANNGAWPHLDILIVSNLPKVMRSSFFQKKGRRFCSYGSACVQHKNPPNVKCKTNQCHGEENGVRCTNRVHHMCSISVGLDEREQSFCPIHCANAKKTCVLVESNIPLPPVSSKKRGPAPIIHVPKSPHRK